MEDPTLGTERTPDNQSDPNKKPDGDQRQQQGQESNEASQKMGDEGGPEKKSRLPG